MIRKYEGTRLGRQELNAELLEDTPGALWSHDIIEPGRQIGAIFAARGRMQPPVPGQELVDPVDGMLGDLGQDDYGVGEDGVTAFTDCGIECLQQIIADERAAGNAPLPVKPTP